MDTEKNLLSKAYNADEFKKNGHALVDLLAEYLHLAINRRIDSALPNITPQQMLDRWPERFPEKPGHEMLPLIRRVIDESNHLHNPRYVGHQVTAPLPLAALSELAGSLLNNASAVYEMGPVNTIMEKRIVQWMAGLIGYDSKADGVLTNGGTLGNLTALLAARQAMAGYNVWSEGIDNKRCLTVLVAEMSHYSIKRAIGVMGLGEESAVTVPVDSNYRMDLDALECRYTACVQEGKTVFAVAASACSTATGTFDDLERIADFCASKKLWLHVDGAHGASLLLSKPYKHLLAGIHRADSVVWDAHKMLLAPALITAVLFKNGSHSYESFSQKASYLFEKEATEEWYNLAQRTMECTKVMMGLKLYIPLMVYGTSLFAEYVTSRCTLTKEFAALIGKTDDFEVALQPQCNIICFRYRKDGCTDGDALQKQLRKKVLENERFYIVQTQLKTGFFMRCTIINPLTTIEDLQELLDTIRMSAASST